MAHREAVTIIAEDMARAPNKRSSMSVASPAVYSILDEPVLSPHQLCKKLIHEHRGTFKKAASMCF